MIKVLLLLLLFSLVNCSWSGPSGSSLRYSITYHLYGDHLVGLGMQRIRMAMIMADDWRVFEVKCIGGVGQ